VSQLLEEPCEWQHLLDLDASTTASGGIRKPSTSDLTNPTMPADETTGLLNKNEINRQGTLHKFNTLTVALTL
jgi:hypothetical protein